MGNEKRLISIFKAFIEKTCLPLIREQPSLFKEWLYFTSIISHCPADYTKVENYVQHLHSTDKNLLTQKTQNTHSSFSLFHTQSYSREEHLKSEADKCHEYSVGSPNGSVDFGKLKMGAYRMSDGVPKERERSRFIDYFSKATSEEATKKPLNYIVRDLEKLHVMVAENHRKL